MAALELLTYLDEFLLNSSGEFIEYENAASFDCCCLNNCCPIFNQTTLYAHITTSAGSGATCPNPGTFVIPLTYYKTLSLDPLVRFWKGCGQFSTDGGNLCVKIWIECASSTTVNIGLCHDSCTTGNTDHCQDDEFFRTDTDYSNILEGVACGDLPVVPTTAPLSSCDSDCLWSVTIKETP